MSTVIEVIDLKKRYIMGGQPLEVLRGVSLTVEHGEIVCVMGPSGSGKSTLLNIVGGLDRPTEGSVLAEAEDLAGMNDERLANYRRHKVGFVFQSFNLIPSMSARRNVELPLTFAGVPTENRSRLAAEALESTGLGHRIDHKPTELSGGEQQRVAIARAVVNQPLVILADEPTGNLDTSTGKEILALIKQMNEDGRTFVISTHDRGVAEGIAHRIVHIVDGMIDRIEVGGVS